MKMQNVLIGGWEFTKEDGIDNKIAELANGKVLLIPDASRFPEKQIDRAVLRYKKYDIDILLLRKGAEKIPSGIKVVYLGGGQPETLMAYFQDNLKLLKDIQDKFIREEIIICGSSTGAMVQFKEMLAQDSRGRGNTNLIPGIGFIKNNAVVIPHWNEPNASLEWRDKFLANHKEKLIITVDEYTSLFWGDNKGHVVGLGAVNVVINGNIQSYKNGEVINDLHLLT